MTARALNIRPLTDDDRSAVREWMKRLWGDARVVVHDTVYRPEQLNGFVAEEDGDWLGLITFRIANGECEVVTLDSEREGQGIGTGLMEAVKGRAERAGCRRIWLITTNDNLHALHFYLKRGYRLVRVDVGAVERSRRIKPQIPDVGENGIPIRDELELELEL